jgi:hypothetical protein
MPWQPRFGGWVLFMAQDVRNFWEDPLVQTVPENHGEIIVGYDHHIFMVILWIIMDSIPSGNLT